MKRKYLIAILLFISNLNLACIDVSTFSNPQKGKHQELLKDIKMQMPGSLFITNDYIVIENPRSVSKFFDVYNRKDMSFKGSICDRGRAETEFLQPSITILDNVATVFDLNQAKSVKYSLDSLKIINSVERNINPILSNLWDICHINDSTFVGIDLLSVENLIKVCNLNKVIAETGKLPIDKNYLNIDLINMGCKLYFDKTKSTLLFLSTSLPYFEKYSYQNGELKLIESKTFRKFDKSTTKNELTITYKDNLTGNIIFTKNYILNLKNTQKEIDDMSSGNPYTNLPSHIFVYNYNLELIKIMKYDIKILRFSVEPGTDNIYAINYDDGIFNLSTISL